MVQAYTSHWRSPLLEVADAVLVSISRGEPRWRVPFQYRRLRSLAPCGEAWCQQERESFEAAYARQLEKIGAAVILERLEEIGGEKPVVLLCWEKPHEPWCHRWQLARFIEERTGILVPELRASTLPRKPDAQPVLFDYREERA